MLAHRSSFPSYGTARLSMQLLTHGEQSLAQTKPSVSVGYGCYYTKYTESQVPRVALSIHPSKVIFSCEEKENNLANSFP